MLSAAALAYRPVVLSSLALSHGMASENCVNRPAKGDKMIFAFFIINFNRSVETKVNAIKYHALAFWRSKISAFVRAAKRLNR